MVYQHLPFYVFLSYFTFILIPPPFFCGSLNLEKPIVVSIFIKLFPTGLKKIYARKSNDRPIIKIIALKSISCCVYSLVVIEYKYIYFFFFRLVGRYLIRDLKK